MIVTIHQPNFLPWLGFFHKMDQADVFVSLDNVQYTKNSYQNRCKIKISQGETWLTVPVLTSGKGFPLTYEVEIDNKLNWAKKVWSSLQMAYSKTPYFSEYKASYEEILLKPWNHLAELTHALLENTVTLLGITTTMLKATDLGVGGESTDLLLAISQKVGASTYLSGPSGKNYLELDKFSQTGIKIDFHTFQHPKYSQNYGEFIPYLSIIDLLFNEGPKSLSLLRQG
jgi:hypothetical protein